MVSKSMDIREFLRVKDKEDRKFFDEVFNKISDEPKICWYPSAGNDYRDILELTDVSSKCINQKEIDKKHLPGPLPRINIAFDYELEELPDIFIHTDYDTEMVNLKEGEIFNDGRTKVIIERKAELEINKKFEVNYHVDNRHVVFPGHASPTPLIYLHDIKLISDQFGEIRKPVIYFLFENINFLQEVLLKHRLNISHIVKVREGCGLGGCRTCISIAYPFISLLNTKYLIIDNEVHSMNEHHLKLFMEILENAELGIKDFNDFKIIDMKPTREIATPIKWSDFLINVIKVEIEKDKMPFSVRSHFENVQELFKPLNERWTSEHAIKDE